MSKKSFLIATDASTVTFDCDLAKSWQVTLGGNRTLVLAGGQEGDEITIALVQDSSGSRTVTWPSNVAWQAGQAPSLSAAANALDVVVLVKRGTTWNDKSGAPSRLPSRILSAVLGTIVGTVVSSAAVLTLVSSNGNGGRPGTASPDIEQGKTGTGVNQVTVYRDTSSGSHVIGATGALVVGSMTLNERGTDAQFDVRPNGNTTVRGTLSGSEAITLSKLGSQPYNLLCALSGGIIGRCKGATNANGDCDCTGL